MSACRREVVQTLGLWICVVVFCSGRLFADPGRLVSDEFASESMIQIPGVDGTLVLVSGHREPPAALARFRELAGGNDARILILEGDWSLNRPSTASYLITEPLRLTDVHTVHVVSVIVGSRASPKSQLQTVTQLLPLCDGLWIRSNFDVRWISPVLMSDLRTHLERGGVIGAAGGPAKWLLPGAFVDSTRHTIHSFHEVFRRSGNLHARFTVGLESKTALIVQGRRAQIIGDGEVFFGLAPSKNRPTRIIRKPAGTTVDLIALSRAAVARAGEEFPARVMRDPVVESGTLFIGGGGQMPEDGMKRFIDASGGPDALIIVIPTAIGSSRAPEFGEQNAQRIRNLGANNVMVMHTLNPREADTDEFCEPLRTAGGIWFTGGRQWNLVDAYRGTQAHELMHDVLKRGGAIGGSSAGASIQAEYMVRGHPLGNTVMMAEGYEKGLDFLPGVGIDQHFAQRDRFADLASVKHTFPQLLCLGIDEQTLLIVQGSIVEVVGPNNLQVYAKPVSDNFDGTEFELVKPGQHYDMKLQRMIEDSP